jgi:hypothetical protein
LNLTLKGLAPEVAPLVNCEFTRIGCRSRLAANGLVGEGLDSGDKRRELGDIEYPEVLPTDEGGADARVVGVTSPLKSSNWPVWDLEGVVVFARELFLEWPPLTMLLLTRFTLDELTFARTTLAVM